MNYSKPYRDPAQQVTILQNRGMVITDIAKAQSYLERIGYYRLSAYWYPFRQSECKGEEVVVEDDFKTGTSFETIFELYVFDKNLRLILLDALERIEIALRTDIALLLGKHDIKAHRNPNLMHGNFAKKQIKNSKGENTTTHKEWLKLLDRKFAKSKEDFVQHFKKKYIGDSLPIWMATELLDFGALSYFYDGLRISDKKEIAEHYSIPSGDMLASWLRCLGDVRNICAHHSRLWNRPLVNRPSWTKIGEIDGFDHTANNTRLYAVLLIIKFLLKTINPSTTWGERLSKHIDKFPTNQYISLKNAGFPENWKDYIY